MLKYLRVAVTALSLAACVVIIPLWLRSYRARDTLEGNVFGFMNVALYSSEGRLTVKERQVWHSSSVQPWQVQSEPLNEWIGQWTSDEEPYKYKFGFGIAGAPDLAITTPHWFPLLLAIAAIGLLYVRWRFSLRTLLIATTMVAVLLAIVAVSR